MSGLPDAWPTRLVVISSALLVAVFIEAVSSVVAALAVPAAAVLSVSTLITAIPGGTASPSSAMTPHAHVQLTARSSVHDQLAIASQWAAPVQGMLILAAVVLIAHIVGTTEAADQRRLNRQMSWLCRCAAVHAILMLVAGVIGVVTDIWGSTGPGVQLHAPILASHVIGTVFAAVAAWLGIGTVAELERHANLGLPASRPTQA
ncbi:MAG TPA: hypothetical protein VHZ02_08945 [Acidimicrobiales bacterium]|nr:hypothetical protein [Acidimicrobiales bacterium]